MPIQFPTHVIETLQQHGFIGDPEHWRFKAREISGGRAYVSFPFNLGFCVSNNIWESITMAQASTTDDDYQILSAQTLDLQNIRGIGKKVRLFADGSMQWQEKDKTKCTSATNGSTQKTLIQWDLALAKKEQNWLSRLLGQKPSITAMRHSLATWNQQLAKLEATKHAMANKP